MPWQYEVVALGTSPKDGEELVARCECDHPLLCRWCWGHGRRKTTDPKVKDNRPVLVRWTGWFLNGGNP